MVGAAIAVSALSLLIPWSLAYDAQAWVVWGRDALDLALDTRSGPSWKPLPVLVTTPLAVTGDAAPALWMVLARTGGLLALVGAAALASRLAGRTAGAAAAAVMALSPWWFHNTILGNSEGLLAAAVLWAVVAHLAGRSRAALALAGAVVGPRIARVLAGAALVWVAIVAVMAQAGYAGNPRYLVAAVSLGCVLAGVGAAQVARRAAVPVATALVLAVALVTAGDLRDQASELDVRADRRAALPTLIERAGGRDALVGCARVRTAPDMRPLVAWDLDLPMLGLDFRPEPPAVILRWRPHYPGPIEPVGDPAAEGFRKLAVAPGWEAWALCGPAPQTTG